MLHWQITLTTALAEYKCIRASAAYKQLFSHLQEQAMISQEVNSIVIPLNQEIMNAVLGHLLSE